jgi:NIMA-interacting peptidyl-prolyl cis-trans isomerase 1
LLVKHSGSRRPASHRDSEGVSIKATSREAAVSILQSFRDAIASGKVDFGVLAYRFSDCSSAKHNGDLGE